MLFKSFKLFGLLVILQFAVILAARTSSSAKLIDMDNEKTNIARCYSDMYCHMIAKDTVALSGLLDESFVLIHMTGMHQPKNEYLRCIADGTLNYFSCNDTQMEIFIDGENIAHMTGKSHVNAAVFGGGRHTWALQLDMKLVKENGRWRFIEARASTY